MGGPRVEQRGFALLDLVIASVIGSIVFALLVTALHQMVVTATRSHALMLARAQAQQLLERMRSEATGAWSITVPRTDINGTANADGHEVDFSTEDSTRSLYRWAYLFDPNAHTVTRYSVAAGASPQPGAAYTDVASFSASAFPANAIADPSSPIYDPLFAGTSVTPVSYLLPDGSVAGNGFVQITLHAAGTSAAALLSTGVAPTQFTVIVKYTPPPQ